MRHWCFHVFMHRPYASTYPYPSRLTFANVTTTELSITLNINHCPTVRFHNTVTVAYFIVCSWRFTTYIWRSCIPVHVGLMQWKCANFEHWSQWRSEINRSCELRSICRLCCRFLQHIQLFMAPHVHAALASKQRSNRRRRTTSQ